MFPNKAATAKAMDKLLVLMYGRRRKRRRR
jgi:hypothetical protein